LLQTDLTEPRLFELARRSPMRITVGAVELVDAAGESYISLEDYAVAMLDELERPRHSRQRFTVGY
jgi:uncharacterized protein